MATRFGRDRLADWMLDPSITYLNHGTVGAVPRRVLEAQQKLRDEIERGPSQVLLREVSGLVGRRRAAPTRVRTAASAVAKFFGARGQDLVFVDNATAGANAVLRSFPFEPGDEILITDHTYGAIAHAANFVAQECGAIVRTIRIPYPRYTACGFLEALAATASARTRLAVLDHISAESSLVLPLKEAVALCVARRIAVLVDGAHAPGQLQVDIPSLGVDWYTANMHKWAHAPRSCGILWARDDRQEHLHPPVISWGLDQGFTAEFDWVGTRDPTPWLAAPDGIAFLDDLDFVEVRRYTHGLALRAAQELPPSWGAKFEAEPSSIASMVTLPLPSSLGHDAEAAATLRDALLDEDHIEVQVHARDNRLWARLSLQVYNEWSDVEKFKNAILSRSRSREGAK